MPSPHRERASRAKPWAQREERSIIAMLLFCGVLPWAGYLALGAWDGRELGIASLVLAFTLRGLWRGRAPRDAAPPSAQQPTHSNTERSPWTSSS